MVMYFITVVWFRHSNQPLTNLAPKVNIISYWVLKWLYTVLWNSQSRLFFHTEESILKFQPKIKLSRAVQTEKPLGLPPLSDLYTCRVHTGKDKDPLVFHSMGMPCAIVTDYQKGFLKHVMQTCPFLPLFLYMYIYKCCIYLYKLP